MFSDRFSLHSSGLNPQYAAKVAIEAAGQTIIDLTQSNPTKQNFLYPANIPSLLNRHSVLEYTPHPKGLPETRTAISDYYKSRGRSYSPEDIVLTTSTSEAYAYLFKLLCNPGDEMLIPSPTYPLFDSLAELENISLVRYPLKLIARQKFIENTRGTVPNSQSLQWEADFKFLKNSVSTRTKALILVNPNNPTGHSCTSAEIQTYLELAHEHNLALIVDEVFCDYILAEKPHLPVLSPSPLVFTLNGFSKLLGLPQLKLGWIHVGGKPSDVNTALNLLETIADTYLSVNSPVQLAAPDLLKLAGFMQGTILDRLKKNSQIAKDLLTGSTCIGYNHPDAGWSLVLQIKCSLDDETFALDLLKTKNILVHSGHLFGFESGCFIVISLLGDPEEFAIGLSQIVAFAETVQNK
jgi:alanine-synthesizing transaminase